MTQRADTIAIGASSLCLVHCLALPFAASLAPLLGELAEAEWIHKLLVICAVAVSGFAMVHMAPGRSRFVFAVPALLGASCLVLGAYVEAFHDAERMLTVAGSLLVTGAHIFRWQRHGP